MGGIATLQCNCLEGSMDGGTWQGCKESGTVEHTHKSKRKISKTKDKPAKEEAAQMVNHGLQCRRVGFDCWVKIKGMATHSSILV